MRVSRQKDERRMRRAGERRNDGRGKKRRNQKEEGNSEKIRGQRATKLEIAEGSRGWCYRVITNLELPARFAVG